MLQLCKQLYDQAKGKRPERWSGQTRNWAPEFTVMLNAGRPPKREEIDTQ